MISRDRWISEPLFAREQRSALLSPDERYRYQLRRVWDARLPLALFLMLNPSWADAEMDDATVCVLRLLVQRWSLTDPAEPAPSEPRVRYGYGGFLVGNLYGLRSRDPDVLAAAQDDPVGSGNDAAIVDLLAHKPRIVVAAWGTHRMVARRAEHVLALAKDAGAPVYTLYGTSSSAQPLHPLARVKKAPAPILWRAA